MEARTLDLQALDLQALCDPMLLWTSMTPAARIGRRPAVKSAYGSPEEFESIGTGIERGFAPPELPNHTKATY
jgi:hypothetical protein